MPIDMEKVNRVLVLLQECEELAQQYVAKYKDAAELLAEAVDEMNADKPL